MCAEVEGSGSMLKGPHRAGAGPGGLTQHRAPSAPPAGPLHGDWSLSHGLNPGSGLSGQVLGDPEAAPVQAASPTGGSSKDGEAVTLRPRRFQRAGSEGPPQGAESARPPFPGAAGRGGGHWASTSPGEAVGETLKCRTVAHTSQMRCKQKTVRRAAARPVATSSGRSPFP